MTKAPTLAMLKAVRGVIELIQEASRASPFRFRILFGLSNGWVARIPICLLRRLLACSTL